jgi:hypothetical protein
MRYTVVLSSGIPAEFDFRYNERVALGVDDPIRMEAALMGIPGKRLTYRDSSAPAADE